MFATKKVFRGDPKTLFSVRAVPQTPVPTSGGLTFLFNYVAHILGLS